MTILKPYQTFSLPIFGPWILFAVWLLVEGLVWQHYGTIEAIDSDFYLTNAQVLSQGHFPTDRGLWYSSYSIFLAFVLGLGGNLTTVVLLQFLFSGIAAFALYKVVYRLFQNYTTAFIAVLQYLLWIKIHQWNSYIYTESLFISFSILSFALLCLSKEIIHYVFAALVVAFTLFLRPTGICFFIGICGYLIFLLSHKKQLSISFLLIIIASALLLILVLVNKMLEEYIYYFIDSYSKAELIYPNVNLGLSAAQQLDKPSPAHAPVIQLIEFILYNPLYFLKLFCIKCLLFLGNAKPYFSWLHNLMIVIVLYPIYTFAVYGFKKMDWTKENVLMISFIGMQILTISMTSENWDGRFLILILPFIFIYSAFGVSCLLKKRECPHPANT
ncbi:MAG: hypothetical protein JWM14_1822 [Chitinophagaceae bacterium]|nr:hypothetical protein [Chitinophagaceae bacterium]